jgi:hypothetical protein
MPMMSVFQARQPVKQYAEPDCFAACGSTQDVQLIKLSIKTGHPVLIGLDGQNSICKPSAEGDEAQSFEALYDTCYTTSHLVRMQQAGVDDPAKIPLDVYTLQTEFDIAVACRITIALAASSSGDALTRLRELLDTDIMFRETVNEEILKIVAGYLVHSSDFDVRIGSTQVGDIEPPLDPNGPQWRILD